MQVFLYFINCFCYTRTFLNPVATLCHLCAFHKSLIKMVYAIAAKSGQRPPWHQLEHAIRRNFGGLTEQTPVDMFKRYFQDADVSTGNFVLKKG